MAKKKKKKTIPRKVITVPKEEISSSPSYNPDATVSLDESLESSTSRQWLSEDATSSPKIGEKTEESAPYAESHAALIDKYLLSRHSIAFVLALCIIGYMFIQDNGAGKLTNWHELWWTIKKSGIVFLLFCLGLLFQHFYKKFF